MLKRYTGSIKTEGTEERERERERERVLFVCIYSELVPKSAWWWWWWW
jgi:hypothetical protein